MIWVDLQIADWRDVIAVIAVIAVAVVVVVVECRIFVNTSWMSRLRLLTWRNWRNRRTWRNWIFQVGSLCSFVIFVNLFCMPQLWLEDFDIGIFFADGHLQKLLLTTCRDVAVVVVEVCCCWRRSSSCIFSKTFDVQKTQDLFLIFFAKNLRLVSTKFENITI